MAMKKFNNTEEALAWIAELFEENPDNVKADTPREKIEAWDSLGMLTLMSRLDEDFNIILEEDLASELKSIADLLAILRSHGCLD